jgi:hypothetical protein
MSENKAFDISVSHNELISRVRCTILIYCGHCVADISGLSR